MAAVARPCPLSHQWASRAVLGISVWVAIYGMAEAAVVSARHRAHAGSPLSDSCLRIAGRRHHPSTIANHLRVPRPRPQSLDGVGSQIVGLAKKVQADSQEFEAHDYA